MSLQSLTTEHILERLRQENAWWATGQVDEEFAFLPKRQYYDLMFPLIRDIVTRRAAVLMGQKRVGKTVLVHQAIDSLLKKGVSPHQIAYISFENPMFRKYKLRELFDICKDATGQKESNGWYVIFDAIEYQKDWELQLESLVDSFSGSKFVAVASANMTQNLNETGFGRFNTVWIPALTFYEYIHLQNLQHLVIPTEIEWRGNITSFFQSTNINLFNEHFIKYLNYGAYPELLWSKKAQISMPQFLKTDILQKVIQSPLTYVNGVHNLSDLFALLYQIALNSGCEFSLEQLSQQLGNIEKNTIKKYLKYLESIFVIQIIQRVDLNGKPYERVNYMKIYLTNPTLRSVILAPISATDSVMNHLLETAIFSQWVLKSGQDVFYAGWVNGRMQGNVEMIGKSPIDKEYHWALKIQWNNRYYESFFDLKSLFTYCETNKLNAALVTTIDKSGSKISNKVKYHFIPAALYVYSLGYDSLIHKAHLNF